MNAEVPATAAGLVDSLLDSYPLLPGQRDWIRLEVRQDFLIPALPNCVSLVLSSLLSNALRALRQCPVPLIRLTVQVQETAMICISDNGPGIAPVIRDRLLQQPVSTHADSGGSGWGLIFCKRIMESCAGSLRIDSIAGSGTTMTLNFPSPTTVPGGYSAGRIDQLAFGRIQAHK